MNGKAKRKDQSTRNNIDGLPTCQKPLLSKNAVVSSQEETRSQTTFSVVVPIHNAAAAAAPAPAGIQSADEENERNPQMMTTMEIQCTSSMASSKSSEESGSSSITPRKMMRRKEPLPAPANSKNTRDEGLCQQLVIEFLPRLVLEVWGGAGAIWGFSEACGLRRPETVWFWRPASLAIGFLFFIRYLLQMRDHVNRRAYTGKSSQSEEENNNNDNNDNHAPSSRSFDLELGESDDSSRGRVVPLKLVNSHEYSTDDSSADSSRSWEETPNRVKSADDDNEQTMGVEAWIAPWQRPS